MRIHLEAGRHGNGARIEHTNSATSRALPLRDSLCTLEVSFSLLLGFSEVAIVDGPRGARETPVLGSESSRVTCRQFVQGVMRGPCRLGLRFWKLAGALFCSAGGCRASRVPGKRGGAGVVWTCSNRGPKMSRRLLSPIPTATEMQRDRPLGSRKSKSRS